MKLIAELDLGVYQGSRFEQAFIPADYELAEDGQPILGEDGQPVQIPIDLTGYPDAQLQIRITASDPGIVAQADCAMTEIAGGFWQVLFSLPPEVTAAITAGPYVYDWDLIQPNGEPIPMTGGAFTVDAEVTR